jgi:hypothetical protein
MFRSDARVEGEDKDVHGVESQPLAATQSIFNSDTMPIRS